MTRSARLVLALVFLAVANATVPVEPQLAIDAGGHTTMVNQVLFAPDGCQLASGSHDHTTQVSAPGGE